MLHSRINGCDNIFLFEKRLIGSEQLKNSSLSAVIDNVMLNYSFLARDHISNFQIL